MKITIEWLQDQKAGEEDVRVFAQEWPNGVEITEATLARAQELSLDIFWLAPSLLSPPLLLEWERQAVPLRTEYKRQAISLWDECERQVAPLWDECNRQAAPLRTEYKRQVALLRKERNRQVVPLWDECNRQVDALRREYNRQVASLLYSFLSQEEGAGDAPNVPEL